MNVTAFVTVPNGLKTVTCTGPGLVRSLAGIAAVRLLLLPNVVVRGAPFHWTTDPLRKFVPLTPKVKSGPPVVAPFGPMEVIVEAAIVKVTGLDVPPPGGGDTTVIDADPATATKLAGTAA